MFSNYGGVLLRVKEFLDDTAVNFTSKLCLEFRDLLIEELNSEE